MTDPVRVRQLDFHYQDGSPVLRDLSLTVPAGSLFGLLGPNGAGKTTLLMLITGLLPVQTGVVEVLGEPIRGHHPQVLSRIALVPQEYAFYPQLTALENLRFFVRLCPGDGTEAERIDEAVRLTGLQNHLHRQARHFSGGLKRRLNLAIGLLNRPQLLILDEPTVGIDPQSRHFILEAIRELNRQGMAILYTSHYMEEVEQICDTVAILDHGEILLQGPLQSLLKEQRRLRIRVREPLTAAAGARLRAWGLEVDGNVIAGQIPSHVTLPAVLETLREAGVEPDALEYGRQTLESLFFQLTHTELREV